MQGDSAVSEGDRKPITWASMNTPAMVLAVLGVVTLVIILALLAALIVGGLAWLVQIVWGAVL